MKLNKIMLTNIASYEGTHEFDFTISDPERNIILIGGQNGAGKTSLFKAIQLALYGPLYFNYQGVHHAYLLKIREFINNRTFTQEHVEASIEINFDIAEGREVNVYNIKRSWTFIDQKMNESVVIHKNGHELNKDEVNFFENYIQTVLPPRLFEFFFFDGEEIASFFLSSRSNTYIKDALLTLCDFDTFEYIRKYSKNYVQRNQNDDALEEVQKAYDHHLNLISSVKNEIYDIEKNLESIIEELEDVTRIKSNLEHSFKNAGGLSFEEKAALNEALKYQEEIRVKESYKQRVFFDELLPFILVKDGIAQIKEQLEKEAEVEQYNLIKSKLNSDFITSILKKELLKSTTFESRLEKEAAEELSVSLCHQIHEQLKPPFSLDYFTPIHDVSKEQKTAIEQFINKMESFNPQTILESVEIKNKAQQIISEINSKLRNSMPEEDVEKYIQELNRINEQQIKLNEQRLIKATELESKQNDLNNLLKEKEHLYETLKSNAQNKNIYEITSALSNMLNAFIMDVSQHKFNDLKTEFLTMFKKIIRKENFVDDLEINDQFDILLYRKKIYSLNELRHLLKNVGLKEFKKHLGHNSMEILMKKFSITKENQLEDALDQALFNEELDLFEKVNIKQFSKGEKQIYILSLYWAMIKISSHEIPFIIDTPYSRIDTEHRDNISTLFFPKISHQVIILSTDEEINKHYYSKLKPFIAKEYLLDYDKVNNKTYVRNKYFFEVTP